MHHQPQPLYSPPSFNDHNRSGGGDRDFGASQSLYSAPYAQPPPQQQQTQYYGDSRGGGSGSGGGSGGYNRGRSPPPPLSAPSSNAYGHHHQSNSGAGHSNPDVKFAHVACKVRPHTAHSTQHTAHSTQHTAHPFQFVACGPFLVLIFVVLLLLRCGDD